jgi:glycosyltransferase involved in cell wall biosynthesis
MSDAAGASLPPVHILFLHSSDDLYGADVILLQLVRSLDRERFIPIVVLPDDMRHVGLLSAELSASGIEYQHLPVAIIRRRYISLLGILPFLRKLIVGTFAVRRLVRERNISLIHGFTLAVAAAPFAAAVTGVPLIMHAHEILQRPKLLRKFLHALAVRWSACVLCVSEAVRRNIVEDQPAAADRIQTVYNGIAALPPPERGIAELRAKMDMPADQPLVGMLARISPWKGQQVFLEAAALVLQAVPDCRFIAIGGVFDGDTQHLDRLTDIQRRLGLDSSVTIAGFTPNARNLIPAFDVLILPSTSPDPFPTVILEAMSAGVPVIATAHGGAVEMIIDSETGLLVPPRDSTALSSAILTLLSSASLRRRLGQAGRERMLSRFELGRYVQDMQDIYTEAIVGGPGE